MVQVSFGMQEAAAQTAGMLPADLAAITAAATAAAAVEAVDADGLLFQGLRKAAAPTAASLQNGALSVGVRGEHLQGALQAVRKRTATAIGAPQVSRYFCLSCRRAKGSVAPWALSYAMTL